METLDQQNQPTLARKLGEVSHVSILWRRIHQMCGGRDDCVGDWLLKCAVERGASHYEREFSVDVPPDQRLLSNEELAVALCLGQHRYNSVFIRAAAQLLSSPATDAARLVRLAAMERVEPVLLHIATVATRFDSRAHPWAYLLQHLRPRRAPRLDALPHWSRLVSQTGVTPFGGGPDIQWLRRRE